MAVVTLWENVVATCTQAWRWFKKNKNRLCFWDFAGFRICIFNHSCFLFYFVVCVLYCLLLTGFALCLVLVPRAFDCPNFLPPVSRSPVYLNPAHGKRFCEPEQTFSSLGPGVQSMSEQLPAQTSQIMACLDFTTPVQTASATPVSPPRTYKFSSSSVGTLQHHPLRYDSSPEAYCSLLTLCLLIFELQQLCFSLSWTTLTSTSGASTWMAAQLRGVAPLQDLGTEWTQNEEPTSQH